MEPSTFPEVLRAAMTVAEMDGQELAAIIKRHPSHVSRLLNDRIAPSVDDIAALGEVFGWDDAAQGRIVRMVAGAV